MSLQRALFRSSREDWETPPDLFNLLDREFRFERDLCASQTNRKCPTFYSRRQDALSKPWSGTCWMNPPYGRAIGAWVRKARQESARGATVVCLLPARTDTRWWHRDVMRSDTIRFLLGRITFVGARSAAPFPSAVVVFGKARRRSRVQSWDWRKALRHSSTPPA